MKITRMEIDVRLSKPSANPSTDALQSLGGSGSVQVTVHTDDGCSGTGGVGFGRVAGAPEVLAMLIEKTLQPLVIGTDPAWVRKTRQAMLHETEYHGSFGLAMFGIAAVDTALWDCLGRSLSVPCWQLWGAVHEEIPAYAMVAWMNHDDPGVQKICLKAVEQGFRAVKIKVGYPTLAEDIHRIKVIRDAVGSDIELMVDANQSLTAAEAIRRGRAFCDLECYWWEEALPADDVDGYAQLVEASDIPIATGENLYTPFDFGRFLRHDAVDIIQPDLRRAGGPTGLLDAGRIADAFRCPYASHGGGPVQLNVMACLPNSLYLETGFIPANSPMKLVDGCAPIPRGPGFSWSEDQIAAGKES